MIDKLDLVLKRTLLSGVPVPAAQLSFQPPNQDWQQRVASGIGLWLNCALVDLREDRHRRSTETRIEPDTLRRIRAPFLMRCHFLISARSSAKRNTDVSKAATAARNAAIKADAAVKAAVKAEKRAVGDRAETQRQRVGKAADATAAQRRLDTSRRYLDALRRGAVPRRAVVRPSRMLTTPNGGRVLDRGFEGRRRNDPEQGHYLSKFPLTDQNYRRMLLGSPPYGDDGQPVNLHHRDGEPMGPLDEYTATQHKKLGLHENIEDSRIDSREFDGQRARHWVERARTLLNAR